MMSNGIITATIKPSSASTPWAAPNPHSLLGGTRMSDPKNSIPYGFCHCGCGERTGISPKTNLKLGYKKGEPRAYIRGHQRAKTPAAYFVNSDSGCWEWQRVKADGYGRVYIKKKSITAHRYFYELHKGPIPDGLHIDHLCRNRKCVNPDHLEAVTCQENIRRGLVTKLTFSDVEQIRSSWPAMTHKQLSAKYGVGTDHIAAIINKRRRQNA